MGMIRTVTSAVSRIGALNLSLKEGLRNLGWSEDQIKSYVDIGCARGNKWISEFWTYGVVDGYWRIRLVIKIDWDEHERLMASSDLITLDNRFDSTGTSIGLSSMCSEIRAIMVEDSMEVDTAVVYTDEVTGDPSLLDRVRSILGTKPKEMVEAAGEIRVEDSVQVSGLSELGVRLETAG